MYTLHLIQTDGELSEAIREGNGRIGPAWECDHATTARTRAITYACRNNTDVVVVRDGNKACYIATKDGRTMPPPGVKLPSERENCVRDSGKVCFCIACRAERREEREA